MAIFAKRIQMRAALCILLAIASYHSVAQEVRVAELAGRSVEMRVIKADDLSPAPWPSGTVELTAVPGKAANGTNIYMLLQANGIAPDPEAFSLFYDLNPDLKASADISADVTLQMPSVAPAAQLNELQSAHALVELIVDPEVRRQLNAETESLRQFEPSVAQLVPKPATQEQIKNLLDWYEQVEKRFRRKTGPPLRHSSLVELLAEARLLDSILDRARKRAQPLSESEEAQVALIHDDIKLEMGQFEQVLADVAPRPQAYYNVTVVVKGISGKVMDSLRVYYTYNGLFQPLPANPPIPSFGFTRLGSGTSENLLKKNYQIWAAKDGDANHPLTTPYPLHVDDTSPSSLTVELSVSQAPK
jgi:hypothetical protein